MVVGAAGEALVSPRWRSAGGGEALVVHSLFRRPPLLDRAADERNEPLHAHDAMILASLMWMWDEMEWLSTTILIRNLQNQIMHDVIVFTDFRPVCR